MLNKLKNKIFEKYRITRKRILMNYAYPTYLFFNKNFFEIKIDDLSVKMSFFHPYHFYFLNRLQHQKHENNLLFLWKKQAEKTNGVVMDIGGYSGIYAILAAKANPKLEVYVFEPDPINFKHIVKNIELNNLSNIVPIEQAVSDQTGEVMFKMHEGGEAGNITKENGDYKVKSITMDDWIRMNNKKPALIKLDVEGAEMRFFVGAEKLVKEASNLKILLELHMDFLKKFNDEEEAFWKLLNTDGLESIYLDECKFNRHYWVYKKTI